MKAAIDLEITEKDLRAGRVYDLNTPDGSRTAELDYSDRGDFRIWFNGEYIHISKTFASFEKRLVTLVNKWELER